MNRSAAQHETTSSSFAGRLVFCAASGLAASIVLLAAAAALIVHTSVPDTLGDVFASLSSIAGSALAAGLFVCRQKAGIRGALLCSAVYLGALCIACFAVSGHAPQTGAFIVRLFCCLAGAAIGTLICARRLGRRKRR